jgi:hypothetical protein
MQKKVALVADMQAANYFKLYSRQKKIAVAALNKIYKQ